MLQRELQEEVCWHGSVSELGPENKLEIKIWSNSFIVKNFATDFRKYFLKNFTVPVLDFVLDFDFVVHQLLVGNNLVMTTE